MNKSSLNILVAQQKPKQANTIKNYIEQYDKSINIIGYPTTNKELRKYIQNQLIDIAFLETRLADGPTFDLFDQIPIPKPVVFTSNSEQDALKAIKVNGVDYLLEPVKYDEFCMAIEKAIELSDRTRLLSRTSEMEFKKRFLVKIGDKLKTKDVEDIAYIFAEGNLVYIVTKSSNRKYIIDHTLDDLENIQLNPVDFFRINRKFIVNVKAIEEVRNYINSRLKLILNPQSDLDMIVSREKVTDFKKWLNL